MVITFFELTFTPKRRILLGMNEKIQTIKNWLGAGSINIFGRPFAGKDTQGELLAEYFDGELMAGGDILRSYHDQEKIKELMSTGDLFPTEFYLSIILPFLSRDDIKNKPIILSSVGRMKGEEETILEATEKSGHEMKAVVLLVLSEDQVMERFNATRSLGDRGVREDDNHEALENRLVKFHEQTEPVIEVYRRKGMLLEVDGTLPREQVTEQIIDLLFELASKAD
jgi:adenylate kinase